MTESITVTGTLGGDPELRFLPSGQAVASFSIADTPRRYNKDKDEWVDGETMWLRCTVWGRDAENVTETLTKGTRVIAIGKLRQNNYETKEGEKRSSIELTVSEIGPSLKFATARVSKNERNGGGNRGGGNGGGRGQASGGGRQDDPWGSGSYAQFGSDDEPPF